MRIVKILSSVAIILLVSAAWSMAQTKWHDPAKAGFDVIQGQAFEGQEREGFYHRFPSNVKGNIRDVVWNLAKDTAGESVVFTTDAQEITVRYTVSRGHAMPHMPATGVSGVDLYTSDRRGDEVWLAGKYSFGDTLTYKFNPIKIEGRPRWTHTYTLFLPLYNEVTWMEIGTESDASFNFEPAPSRKPIVAYGTSIAQGACASRPGMAWTNILQRRMDREVINLGFSGNALLENEVVDLLAEIDADVYLLDAMPNVSSFQSDMIRDTVVNAVKRLRGKRPGTPIVLVDHLGYPHGRAIPTMNERESRALKMQKDAYEQLIAEGVKGLHYLSYDEIAMPQDGTVEGIHASDYGMVAYADAYEKKLCTILNQPQDDVMMASHVKSDLRAPAYPLITIDPYVSTWMPADRLYDETAIHWTETDMPLMGIIRVDGEYYRFMGAEDDVNLVPVVPMGKDEPWEASYTFEEPAGDWKSIGYDYSSWKVSAGPFGEGHQEVKTPWLTPEIWLRRTIVLDEESITDNRYFLYYTHDGQMELYVNGDRIVATGNSWKENHRVELTKEQLEEWNYTLEVAAHCKWFSDARYIDFGIYHNDNSEKLVGRSAKQVSVDAQATRTIYDFTCAGVDLKVTFTAPLLMDDLDLVSRPVNYISYEVLPNDGKEHEVEIYFEAGPHWARYTDDQKCVTEISHDERFAYIKCGTQEQPVLEKFGDFVRIDWGYFYMVGDKDRHSVALGAPEDLRERFIRKGDVSGKSGEYMAMSSDLGKVGANGVADYIMLGYDDIYSILYYNEKVRPYWNRNGDSSIQEQFALAADEYESVVSRCEDFDLELMKDAYKAGGKEYAELCALSYRQAMAAHKLIQTPKGELAWLSKENSSNGCIGTVDVTYPSFPLFLYYNTDFAKAQLDFIYELSKSSLWDEPYAPHDVGTYPHVFGQRYDGGMPVEESGNMLIMTDAICQVEGSADYALKNWDLLTLWADYLTEHGGDPVNQLCTDDFMGHSARNANLSVKAIMGVASYADMAAMQGMEDVAQKYYRKAKEMAADWKKMAYEGDHYRLTFEPGADTWSQKYNLVWDKVLGFSVFDKDIVATELAYYATKANEYGLPLDSRNTCTKSDWLVWTATLTDDDDEFRSFVVPMYNFVDETTARIPIPDLYYTTSNAHSSGWLQARSVVGGFWIKMLSDKMTR